MDLFRLNGDVALVTGADSGIGRMRLATSRYSLAERKRGSVHQSVAVK
jgi:hypothetical protein